MPAKNTKGKPAWKKLLWVKQPYPDNYVDKSFLSQLQRNSNVGTYNFWTVVSDTTVLLGNAALTLFFCGSFVAIYELKWDPKYFALGSSLLSFGLAMLYGYHIQDTTVFFTSVKSAILILFAVLSLTPIFTSLTRSTSSDSIWSISAWLCAVNLAFSSRPLPESSSVLILSINIALCAAIVLASRLHTPEAVFWFMVFSIQVYVLLPTVARWLRRNSSRAYWALFSGLMVASSGASYVLMGWPAVFLWWFTALAIVIGVPGLFLALQKYKDQIKGPWDPARPIMTS
ncbi:Phosphatidylinositol N-acetylglucosaminyltransferase GPI2 subunit [Wickerhamiella sorbophila]|uniref:Phosphatidylinositol N-acetylglucosaminyltransferase GPI2 subunit n=1 Tax=Wickerhamiella sorbophila TaxID=45607 RepID=A0A2T0FM81_9ASCO|nr:Phosphatidylinositol N-acetylglucosaminyltransferase GPI2 subunit [Wickerhamiella sorbophila]PRT56094.1 Phosphatidylinositol N-acetylglucosaminyltransferase GPI2 subunit [Wickerhamiella sorbophila]